MQISAESCQFIRQDGARLVSSQGRMVQDLLAYKYIGMRLVGLSSKVQAPVGQQ